MVPVSILTGFLGSGKTTLLRGLLRDPRFARSAVIINEFGEIGLDHDLIESSDENLVRLSTGCLCCSVRGDLIETVMDLIRRRNSGELQFDRVLIETSGLADPAPVLSGFMADPGMAENSRLMPVVTVVDAKHGWATLDEHVEARKQVAVADRILLTKTDVAGEAAPLRKRLGLLNPIAPLMTAVAGQAPYELLFGNSGASEIPGFGSFIATANAQAGFDLHDPQHTHGIVSFSLVREKPVPAVALALLIEALVEHAGSALLRVKGLVQVAEMPDRPAVLHGVQHVFEPLDWLDQWPSDDRRTRIVFIGRAIPVNWPRRLLQAIESESF
ncbi:GTP-binding protein [Mesorhizobium sp. M0244]|uniref:CobW family GTP-binding protein n=1 Tax=Mesorhizobium sp. M0244 TaxID=2956926 RepID=UPI003334DA69